MIERISDIHVKAVFDSVGATVRFPAARQHFNLTADRSATAEMLTMLASPIPGHGLIGLKATGSLKVLSLGARALDIAMAFALWSAENGNRISVYAFLDQNREDLGFATDVARRAGLEGIGILGDITSIGLKEDYDVFVARARIRDFYQRPVGTLRSLIKNNTAEARIKRFYFVERSTEMAEDMFFLNGLRSAGFGVNISRFNNDPAKFPYWYIAAADMNAGA